MHHESELSEEMKQLFAALPKRDEIPADVLQSLMTPDQRLKLGATGNFPEGKLTVNDEGEIRFAVGVYKGKVVVNFGGPVASLGMTAKQARSLARSLLHQASKAESQEK